MQPLKFDVSDFDENDLSAERRLGLRHPGYVYGPPGLFLCFFLGVFPFLFGIFAFIMIFFVL